MVCRNFRDDPPTEDERDQDLEREFEEIEDAEETELDDAGQVRHFPRIERDLRDEVEDDESEHGGEA